MQARTAREFFVNIQLSMFKNKRQQPPL